ncbi:MAG: YdbL family protein [Pseudomonadales bacterium]|jgi:hypothetical protein|nr:YdbL family protein [Pseudomonadales bacterium]MDP6471886.1 YdbL family protein [Pseudomonadales bacterium]MDP6826844.1 YdbL family protein [Pseudomonadales bacterium]MDP6970878.1 YdbL family protein [Pseudomonadales bacterium]|tara:strand:+ start:1787 stop:2131 length:345 start_codon:yes stop_codon:yes gene_type:complete
MKSPTSLFSRLILAMLIMLCAASATAADLTQAKAQGWLGEQLNGYLGLVSASAPADVRALKQRINTRRQARYRKIAAQQGVPVREVEKVGGQKAIQKTLPGNWIRGPSGAWRRK